MVNTSGFTHAPISRFLILSSIALSTLVSILDIKHLLPLKPTPHFWPYLQFTRLLTFQVAYTAATEVLVSTALLYHFRILERIWGSRKYASFLLVVFMLNVLATPALCLSAKMLSLGTYNYIPAGLTAVVFAALSAWTAEVPGLYRWKLLASSSSNSSNSSSSSVHATASTIPNPDAQGVTLSDKSTTYLLAAQLALSQFPYGFLPATVGWVLGAAWQSELLPGGMSRWRVPRWLIGESERAKERGQYEGLRRRLEAEGSAGGDGMRNVADQAHTRAEERRGFLGQVSSYFAGS